MTTTTRAGTDNFRPWLFRLCGLVLIPALVLCLAEAALRLAEYGYRPAFFKKALIQGQDVLVENDQFGLSFFPPALLRIPAPVVMEPVKTPGQIRIFVFGESAALGDPRPNYGAGRYLEILLREHFPGKEFEVVNTSMTAINSHVILPIARECAKYQGDFWIIYMGNNEMVGPYGAASVAGARVPPLPLIRASLALQRFRIGQLLMACSRKVFGSPSAAAGWRGMEMFLQNELAPGDPRKERVYENFQRNLQDILQAGTSAGAETILNTVAVNLKDCPPFASSAAKGSDLTASDPRSAEAGSALDKGDAAKAQQLYQALSERFPESANLQYQLGTSYLRLGALTNAAKHFQKAVDLDALPFRTDSRINSLIKEAAKRFAPQHVVLCDAAAILNSNARDGVAGQESFYEHVHLNFEGNYRLGLAWARQIESLLPPDLRRGASNNWASEDICERRLGLTDWNRLSTLQEVVNRLERPPLSRQLNNAARLQEFQAMIADLKRRTTEPENVLKARSLYREALDATPSDHCLHENFAEFLEAVGDRQQTALEWEKARDLIPHYYLPHYNLGIALEAEGKLNEARDSLNKAARLNGSNGDIRLEIGITYARQGMWETALDQFKLAHELDPNNPRELLYSGEMLMKLSRNDQAVQAWQQAIHLRPDYWQAHYRLGEEFARRGQVEAAANEFRETVRCNPGYAKAHENLGVAFYKLGRNQEAVREFEETLRLDPQNQTADQFKRLAQERGSRN